MKDFESNRTQIMNSIENRVRQAYNSGYDMGFHDGEIAGYSNWQDGMKNGFRKGLEEAWECAKSLNYKYHSFELRQIFDYDDADVVLAHFTAYEAIEKIREYESKLNEPDKEIRVGDEIVYETGAKSVVSRIRDDFCYCIDGVGYPKERCEKTGRHFPQIEEVIKQMEGAAE